MSGRVASCEFGIQFTMNSNIPNPSSFPILPTGWKNIGWGEAAEVKYNKSYVFCGPKDTYKKVRFLLDTWAKKNNLEHRFEKKFIYKI